MLYRLLENISATKQTLVGHIFAVHLVMHHVTKRLTFRNFGTIALANGSPLSFPQKTQASLLTVLSPWLLQFMSTGHPSF